MYSVHAIGGLTHSCYLQDMEKRSNYITQVTCMLLVAHAHHVIIVPAHTHTHIRKFYKELHTDIK